jgi:hypothetical protein
MSHPILGQLAPEEQRWELEQSKKALERELGCSISCLAYPVGSTGVTETTQQIALAAGYTACFSSYGGINLPPNIRPGNLLRGTADPDPLLFRAETAALATLGWLPY